MKKHETIKRVVEEEEYKVTELCCNKCGTKSKIHYEEDGYEADFTSNEYQTFSTHFGYGSRFDMERWEFELCEDCLVEFIKTFKYSPSGFGQENYYVHNEQATFEHWKETGQIDIEAGMTPEEIKESNEYFDSINDLYEEEDDTEDDGAAYGSSPR